MEHECDGQTDRQTDGQTDIVLELDCLMVIDRDIRVFPSLDRVSGTLCLSHYVTEISHLHSLRDF